MHIALIQTKQNRLYDFAHPRPIAAAEARALSREMAEQTFSLMADAARADLIVTTEAVNYPGPEAWTEGPYGALVEEEEIIRRFSDHARQNGCWIVASLYAHRYGGLVNEAVVFDRQGRQRAVYEKVHLAGDEQRSLIPGQAYCAVDADFGRMGVCICWDMQFPEVCRHYALAGCSLVVCPTWGWESIYAACRAYENGIWVAGAMAVPFEGGISGIRAPSQVIAPDGGVRASGPRDRAAAVTCSVDLHELRPLHALRMHDRRPDTYAALVKQEEHHG
ncbi:MAG: carbon-nitrogen hydrolase family protein [Clostridia bacterium]|nr:carbon-nitrogen hydrolase family protein [Clostridia bacterium]